MFTNAIIIEDHHQVSDSIAWLLSEASLDFSYIPVNSINRVNEILKEHPVELLIIDLKGSENEIRNYLKTLKQNNHSLKTIIISYCVKCSFIKTLISGGVDGLILKINQTNEIVDAVIEVMNGNKYMGRDINNIINGIKVNGYPTLTCREKEVLHLIAEGYTNPEISKMLFISHFTVDSHRKNLLCKFNTPNTAALIKNALLMGIIES